MLTKITQLSLNMHSRLAMHYFFEIILSDKELFMEKFELYLIVINSIGFILYLVNMWLYDHMAKGNGGSLLTIVTS